MEQRILDLEDELGELRSDLRNCRLEIARLRRLVEGGSEAAPLESAAQSEPSFEPPSAPGIYASTLGSYSVVGAAASSGQVAPPVATPSIAPDPQPWTERENICTGIGHWVLRCLADRPRGSSGRDRLVLSSRVWLVIRDFEGRVLEPARLYHRFSDCRGVVKRGSDLGLSIFVGLPSIREARVVAAVAGTPFV